MTLRMRRYAKYRRAVGAVAEVAMRRIQRRTLFDLSLGAVAVVALASAVPGAGRETGVIESGRIEPVELSVWLPATIHARPDPGSAAVRSLPPQSTVTVAWDSQVVTRGGRVWVRVLAPAVGWLPGSAVSPPGRWPAAARLVGWLEADQSSTVSDPSMNAGPFRTM